MELANLGGDLSFVREHLQLFTFLLFGVPLISFACIKFWAASHSAKVQRTTNWFVPTDLESETARTHYGMGHQSVAFAHQINRNSRHAVAARKSNLRRSA
jgi:hypothetical protein